MKAVRLLTVGVVGLICFDPASVVVAQGQKAKSATPPARRSVPSQREVSDAQRDLIEKMKASRESLEKLRAVYEKQLDQQSIDYDVKKSLYEKDFISRQELEQSERALNNTRFQLQQVRRWMLEDDIALGEALAREELSRLPGLARGGYSETTGLIRYNGPAKWSLADAGKIERFFSARFGHALPVSAMGQTPAHDRMGFDHRDAMDVALYPDSEEGRVLMQYLREAGIPFIAFRNRVAGSATGAHIHIGKPSLRLAASRQGG